MPGDQSRASVSQTHSRMYPRINVNVPVDYSTGRKARRCKAVTLSGGGLFLTNIEDLDIGAELAVSFRPAKRLPVIEAKVRVLYVVPEEGTAVEFTEIDPEDRHVLLKMIHQKTGDRRIIPRAPFAAQVECDSCTSLAFARDLSLAGMFLEVDTPLPVGTRLKVRFNLDDGKTLVSTAGYVSYHIEKMGMGILFTETTEESYRAIENYVVATNSLAANANTRHALN